MRNKKRYFVDWVHDILRVNIFAWVTMVPIPPKTVVTGSSLLLSDYLILLVTSSPTPFMSFTSLCPTPTINSSFPPLPPLFSYQIRLILGAHQPSPCNWTLLDRCNLPLIEIWCVWQYRDSLWPRRLSLFRDITFACALRRDLQCWIYRNRRGRPSLVLSWELDIAQ